MQRLLKMDSVMFFVKDLIGSARFHENVLGLRRVWSDEARGMIGFVLAQSDSEVVIHNDPTLKTPSLSFLVEDVVRFCESYRSAGHVIRQGPFDVRCGNYAVLADPDGNEIPIIDLTAFGNKPRYDV